MSINGNIQLDPILTVVLLVIILSFVFGIGSSEVSSDDSLETFIISG